MDQFETGLVKFSRNVFEAFKNQEIDGIVKYGLFENRIDFSLHTNLLLKIDFTNYNYVLLCGFSDPEKFSNLVLENFRWLNEEHDKMLKLGFIRLSGFYAYDLSFKDHDVWFRIIAKRISNAKITFEILKNGIPIMGRTKYSHQLVKTTLDYLINGDVSFSMLPSITRDNLIIVA